MKYYFSKIIDENFDQANLKVTEGLKTRVLWHLKRN
jgi:hypothetical protein